MRLTEETRMKHDLCAIFGKPAIISRVVACWADRQRQKNLFSVVRRRRADCLSSVNLM